MWYICGKFMDFFIGLWALQNQLAAFDTLNHKKVLSYFRVYLGIVDSALNLMKEYLSEHLSEFI